MSILQYFSIVFNARVILFTRSVALLVWLCMCVSMHACVYVGVKEKVWPVSVQQGSTRLRWKLLLHYPVKFFPHYNLFANFQLYTFFFILFFFFLQKNFCKSCKYRTTELNVFVNNQFGLHLRQGVYFCSKYFIVVFERLALSAALLSFFLISGWKDFKNSVFYDNWAWLGLEYKLVIW